MALAFVTYGHAATSKDKEIKECEDQVRQGIQNPIQISDRDVFGPLKNPPWKSWRSGWVFEFYQARSEEKWMWTDRCGKKRSLSDLDQILKDHELWLNSSGNKGAIADFADADLTGAILIESNLRYANFIHSKLTGVRFDGADLQKANFEYAMGELNSNGDRLMFGGADLRNADFDTAQLKGVEFNSANLDGALLQDSVLDESLIYGANLSQAQLFRTSLSNAQIRGATFDRTIFEPITLPTSREMATAQNLESMTFAKDPDSLVALRKLFSDNGYDLQARRVTYALRVTKATKERKECSLKRLSTCVNYIFNRIAFDFTCQYGLDRSRPLLIIAGGWIVFGFVYFAMAHSHGKSTIIAVAYWGEHQKRRRVARMFRFGDARKTPMMRRLRKEYRLLKSALAFSFVNLSSLGFKELDPAKWVKLISHRDYDVRGSAWVRSIAGTQSLLSVYCLALWVLTYFGQPFAQ